MKKQSKSQKSLVLTKHTVAALSAAELAHAAGGEPYSKLSVCELNQCTRNN